ncbi:MAG TPA: prolyl oligopeptidase family serine peptidase, partial [Bacteroidia bacterium]|nr:prolyl oligopeptidase family serine peptidase [Bacteroidia bacterium]
MKILFVLLFVVTASLPAQEKWIYPETTRGNQTDTIWHTVVKDPYRWMEKLYSPEVLEWLKAQKKLADAYKGSLFRTLSDQISAMRYNTEAPDKQGKYFFRMIIEKEDEVASLFYSRTEDGEMVRLFDPNRQSFNDKVSIAGCYLSDNNRYLALSLSKNGGDWKTIRILDMQSHDLLRDRLEFVKYSPLYWYKDGFFYSHYHALQELESQTGIIKGRKLYYHKLGTEQTDDVLVYSSENEFSNFNFSRTPEGKYLVLYTAGVGKKFSWVTTLIPLNDSLKFIPHTLIISKSKDVYFDVLGELGGKLLVRSNLSAPNGAIFAYNPDGTNDREVFADPLTEQLNGAYIFGGHLILTYSGDKQNRAIVRNKTGKEVKILKLPEGSVFSGFAGGGDEDEIYYGFSSFYKPVSLYKLNLKTYVNEPRGHTRINFSNKNLITEKVYYYSKDSTRVGMYITHLKTMKLDGCNPLLLEGYGGFGISTVPYFSAANMIFLNNGGVLGNPCIRGGGEMPGWHEKGIRLNKQNSFNDFISAAEYLIAGNYTHAGRMVIKGGSNGGFLVAACMEQRPDLFKAVVCQSGVLDLMREHLYNIGYSYMGEYGTIKDSADFFNMLKLSPVHNVKAGIQYPATLLVASDNDDR